MGDGRRRGRAGADGTRKWRRCGSNDGFVVRFPETEDAARRRAAAARPGRDRSARARRAREHRALRVALPRGGGARAAAAEAPARRARAAVAAAQAGGGSARRRRAVRLVPDAARDVSRVPARRLRHAGARRDADRHPRRPHSRPSPSTRRSPSPFAASILFGYVANFIYEGDAPLAERRAQALAIDQAQLRELLGDAELRELLDPDVLESASSASSSGSTSGTARAPPTACTICSSGSAISRATSWRGARDASSGRSRSRDRSRRSCASGASLPVTVAGTAALHRDRGRAPLPGRARRVAAGRRPGRVPRARARRARRSRPSVRAYARAVHHRRAGAAATALARERAEGALRRMADAGKLLEGEFRPRGDSPRMVRCRRAPHAAPPLARAACATRSSPSSRPCSGGSSPRGRASCAGAPGSTRCSTSSRACRARRSRPRSSRPRSCRRASKAIAPAISTRSPRRAKSRGSAWSHSASATAASRSISPTRLPTLWRPAPLDDAAHRARGAHRGGAPRTRRLLLRGRPRGRRRRIRGRHGRARCGASSGAGLVTNDTFTALRAFTAPPERRDRRATRRRRPFRSRRTTPPTRRRPMVADGDARGGAPLADRVERGRRAAAARALRRGQSRDRAGGVDPRRLRRRVRRLQGARGERSHPPRLLRVGRRCRAVRAARPRSRSCAALREEPPTPEVVQPRRDRSGESVRRDPEVAGRWTSLAVGRRGRSGRA